MVISICSGIVVRGALTKTSRRSGSKVELQPYAPPTVDEKAMEAMISLAEVDSLGVEGVETRESL